MPNTTREDQLARLLRSLYTVDELRRDLRADPALAVLDDDLTTGSIAPSTFSREVVDACVRLGLVPALLGRATESRPRRAAEIAEIALLWSPPPPVPQPPAPTPGAATLAALFGDSASVSTLLHTANLDSTRFVPFGAVPALQWWRLALIELDKGVADDDGLTRLLRAAAREFPGNVALKPWLG